MDENKRPTGRPQIYDGESSGYGRELEYRRRRRVQASRDDRNRPQDEAEPPRARSASAENARRERDAGKNVPEEQTQNMSRVRSASADRVQDSPGGARGAQAEEESPRTRRTSKTEAQDSPGGRRQALRSTLERGSDSIRRSAESVTGSTRRREKENARKMQALIVVLGVLVILLIAAFVYEVVLGNGTKQTGQERMAAQENQDKIIEVYPADGQGADGQNAGAGEADGAGGSSDENAADGQDSDASDGTDDAADGTDGGDAQGEGTDGASGSAQAPTQELLETAQRKAMQYDYDGAISLLKNTEGYAENTEYQAEAAKFEEQKAACVPYPASDVTHIFFHTLIHDASKAFDGDEYEDGYNQFMVTEYEFNSIIEQMYERGYVMVFIDEIAPGTDDGNGGKTFAARDILLPEGKIPFVLSQDDVSYYHYMDGDGFASRLIVDENGDVKNEYIEDDGSVSVGDYDMVPLIDRFVEKHPDFSYHGEKGYVALTGYEGILGYRTDEVYKTKEEGRVTVQQQMFFGSYPGGFDEAAFERECEGAKKVAGAMKANGWKFASHTWGHQNLSEVNGIAFDKLQRDTDRWETWVEPLIGETDTLIYAFGGDIRDANKYSGERFDYLKQCGFDYYCGVDSAKHWLQVEPNYVRQSRRNIDGYRMYYNPDMLDDLFDVQKAWDPLRPSSVPPI